MRFKTEKYQIAECYICYLINGDPGDLSDDEMSDFDRWEYGVRDNRFGHWAINDTEDNQAEGEYGICDVTGLYATVYPVAFCYRPEHTYKITLKSCRTGETETAWIIANNKPEAISKINKLRGGAAYLWDIISVERLTKAKE